jgi:hypothetical protein
VELSGGGGIMRMAYLVKNDCGVTVRGWRVLCIKQMDTLKVGKSPPIITCQERSTYPAASLSYALMLPPPGSRRLM